MNGTTKPTLQSILTQFPAWKTQCKAGSQKVLGALSRCRTASMGYHLYRCSNASCGQHKMQYHSCRNRHCPGCGGSRQQDWVEARMRELLPCDYYHLVFTVPHALNSLVLGNRKELFDMLFKSAHETLEEFGKNPRYLGGRAGIISVLHTWGQNLSFHPHVHCIVSSGGLRTNSKIKTNQNEQQEWVKGKKNVYGVLYPVQAMRKVYRAIFIKHLEKAIGKGKVHLKEEQAWQQLKQELYGKDWIVYAKKPFGGPAQVVEYLGRYTHKVAIGNNRIREITAKGDIVFAYKDYADGNKQKQMSLEAMEFIRRFEQHLLPSGYCRIRGAGLYANQGRRTRISKLLQVLQVPQHAARVETPWYIKWMTRTGQDPLLCGCCKQGRLELVEVQRPKTWSSSLQKPPE